MGGGGRREGTVGTALPAARGAGCPSGTGWDGSARERCEAEVSTGGL